MSSVFVWGVLAGTVTWAWCTPIAYGWDHSIAHGYCANRNAGYLAVGIIDPVTDFFILILPLPVIFKLQIPRFKQFSLALIFSIAILCIIISAIRAYYAEVINFENFTDSRSMLDVLTALEPAISIIVASSLVLGPVLKKWFGHSTQDKFGPGTATLRENPSHRFQRIDNIGLSTLAPSSQNIELGVRTTAEQGSKRTPWDLPLHGSGHQDRMVTEMERMAVKDGKAISVRKDLSVSEA